MNMTVNLEAEESVGLLPEAAIKQIQDVLFIDAIGTSGREQQLETYCKMLFNAVNVAEAKLIATNKSLSQYKKMFHLWAPHVKALRRKA